MLASTQPRMDTLVRLDSKRLYEIVGKQIRSVRMRRTISQRALGKKTALSNTYICHVESGDYGVSLSHLYRIASALGVPPSELLPDPADESVAARTV